MTQNIIIIPEREFILDDRGLGYVYYKSMSKNRNDLAQVDGLTGEKDTFGKLLLRAVRVALHMKDKGVRPGDTVCTCTFNHLNSAVPLIASMFIGAISTSVDPTLSLTDIVHLLKLVNPKMMFVQTNSVEKINTALKIIGCEASTVVFGDTVNSIPFTQFLQYHQQETTFTPWIVNSLQDIAFIFFTSGTTGFPKAICHNHYMFLSQTMEKMYDYIPKGPLPLNLSYASPYWVSFAATINYSLIRGVARLICPRYDPSTVWEMFEYNVTMLFISTIQMVTMLKQGRPKHVNSDSLLNLYVGGDIAQKQHLLELKKIFPNTIVRFVYGLTELLTVFDVSNPTEAEMIDKKTMSVGTGLPGRSYKIADIDNGEALGPNLEGELQVKTKIQTTGYYNTDSSEIWDSEGWLKTGDVGYYDEDQCFFIVGRIKEMFKYKEWHISPSVLEEVLNRHPAVASSAVIGVPHAEDGSHPMAFVVVNPSHPNATGDEIVKFFEENVDDRKRLRAGVRIVENLPITSNGKLNRRLLKNLI